MSGIESDINKKNVFPIDKSYLYFTLNVLSCFGKIFIIQLYH